jgi:integrase
MHPKRKWIQNNPTDGIEFFPVEKRIKYVPPKEDVFSVILAADRDTKDYLWTIMLTMGRMSEINRLTWQDINFKETICNLIHTEEKRWAFYTSKNSND